MISLEQLQLTSQNTIVELLGIKLTEASLGRVVATMPVDARTHQPFGILHGGASVVLAETIASMGGELLVSGEGKHVSGQEINANHLRPVSSGTVTGIGEVIHQGKTSQVWEIKIYNEEKKLVCISRCTLAVR
jgi:1,4-dihydroxy-2-naphthoyl-CoA hydrolase